MNELELRNGGTPAGGRSLEVVAAEIRALTAAALNNIVEIGRRMHEAKAMLPHGEFGRWIQENTGYSTSTANNFMRIFDAYADPQGSLYGAEVNCQTFGNLSYSKALALLALPADEREEFAAEHDVEGMSTRELQAAIRERDEARRAAEEAAVERNLAEEAREKLEKEMTIANGRMEGLAEELKQAREQADRDAAAAREEAEALRGELEALRAAPATVAVETKVDQGAIDAAAAEAKAQAEAALKAKIEKAEKAKEKAEQAKAKAEGDLAALKVAQEQAGAIAEQEKKALAGQVEDLRKKLAVASSGETTVFKLYFDQVQEHLNRMGECIARLEEAGNGESAGKLRSAAAALLDAAKEALGL